jgi:hypothetical protein
MLPAAMKFDLQLRDLKTGTTSQKTFESIEDGLAWLKQRPKFTDVMGIGSHHVPREISDQLRAAMKPLDAEEKALDNKLRDAREKAAEAAAKARAAAEAAEAAHHLAKTASADPKRPMDLRWTYKDGLSIAEAADKRDIPDVVREAVDAWVAERNSWVEGRNQVVGDARLRAWPSDIPEDEDDERIISGTFIPVAAPKKEPDKD